MMKNRTTFVKLREKEKKMQTNDKKKKIITQLLLYSHVNTVYLFFFLITNYS